MLSSTPIASRELRHPLASSFGLFLKLKGGASNGSSELLEG